MTNPETPLEIAKRIANCHIGATEADALALARAVLEAEENRFASAVHEAEVIMTERARIVAAIRNHWSDRRRVGAICAHNVADWIERGCLRDAVNAWEKACRGGSDQAPKPEGSVAPDWWRTHAEAGWDRAEALAREVLAVRETIRALSR